MCSPGVVVPTLDTVRHESPLYVAGRALADGPVWSSWYW